MYFSVSTLITRIFTFIHPVVKQKLGTNTCIPIFQPFYIGCVHSEAGFSVVLTPRIIEMAIKGNFLIIN
jgi:hypothetical protein